MSSNRGQSSKRFKFAEVKISHEQAVKENNFSMEEPKAKRKKYESSKSPSSFGNNLCVPSNHLPSQVTKLLAMEKIPDSNGDKTTISSPSISKKDLSKGEDSGNQFSNKMCTSTTQNSDSSVQVTPTAVGGSSVKSICPPSSDDDDEIEFLCEVNKKTEHDEYGLTRMEIYFLQILKAKIEEKERTKIKWNKALACCCALESDPTWFGRFTSSQQRTLKLLKAKLEEMERKKKERYEKRKNRFMFELLQKFRLMVRLVLRKLEDEEPQTSEK